MLFVRLSRGSGARGDGDRRASVSYGRVLPGAPDVVELLDGDPIPGRGRTEAFPTGERLPYTPDAWQRDPDGEITLLPPVRPGKILGVGSNYKNHAREMGKPIPSEPILFMKPPSAVCDPGRAIQRPAGYERVDYEGELAVVIGTRLHRASVDSVASHIFGYTILNDVSVRDLQKKDGQFTRAKGFDTFCPLGPAIATGFDLAGFRMRTRLHRDGVTKQVQDSQGDQMVFSVYELVAFASHIMTLEAGDVITTGTPAGVGNIQPGDVIEIEIEGIGTLRSPVEQGPEFLQLPPRPASAS